MARDPVIHGVATDHADFRHLLANVLLQHRVNVGQEEELAILIHRRHLGSERLEDVQLGIDRLRFVKALNVRPGPMKAFARSVFQSPGIDSALGQDGFVFRGEVFAPHANHPHIGEVTCGQGEVSGCAPQTTIAPARWGLDAVKCNTAYDEYGHGFLSLQEWYLPSNRSSLLRVAAGIASGLVRMAYLSAVTQGQVRSRGIAATAARTAVAALAEFWCSTATTCSTVTDSCPSCQQS